MSSKIRKRHLLSNLRKITLTEQIFPSSLIIFTIWQKKFITNFVTAVTSFLTHVTNFVMRVTKFVIKKSYRKGKNSRQIGKNIRQQVETFKG